MVILLVEDNEDNVAIYRTLLEHLGHVVLVAADGEVGIRLARERNPDVILMDLSLPKVDGLHATRKLKADPRTAHIPVIALTAHALVGDEERAREAGCDGYFAKPIEPQRVAEAISRYAEPDAR